MNKKPLTIYAILITSALALVYAGPEPIPSGKEMKQIVPPCPEWYADYEWDISMWGAYAFTETESERTNAEHTDDLDDFGTYDRFLGGDHAWGGGVDAKYFFARYFGVGIEGFALDGRGSHIETEAAGANEEFAEERSHVVGGVLGTFTLRYPFHCSRFAPYVWAGGGGIFGGRNDRPEASGRINQAESIVHDEEESRVMGQFGAGLEIRITRHIGWTGDFSWNVLEGPHNNFGLVRSGLNLSF